MDFSGNPKKYARDIAAGYALLRGYDLEALRTLKQAVEVVLREARSELPSPGGPIWVQDRQRRILRHNQGLQVMRTCALKRRLQV